MFPTAAGATTFNVTLSNEQATVRFAIDIAATTAYYARGSAMLRGAIPDVLDGGAVEPVVRHP